MNYFNIMSMAKIIAVAEKFEKANKNTKVATAVIPTERISELKEF